MREHLQDAIIHLMYDTSDSVSLKDAIHMVLNNYYFAPYSDQPDEDDIIECIESLRPYILFTHGKLYPTPMFKAQVREWFDGKVSLTYGAQSLNRLLTDLYGSYYENPILDIVGA